MTGVRAQTGEFKPTLTWLAEILSACNLAVDLVLEPRPDDPMAPVFDYGVTLPRPRVIPLEENGSNDQAWRESLVESLNALEWTTCLLNLVAVPRRSLRTEVEGRRLEDGAAFLAEVLKSIPEDKIVAAFAPANVPLTNDSASALRGWLAEHHRVEWIIWLGPEAARSMGAHSALRLALLVIRTGLSIAVTPRMARLADLSVVAQSEWPGLLSAVAKRGGGEVATTIVLRNPLFDEEVWTYERFSKHLAARRQDAAQLGTLRPLGELAEFGLGMHRTVESNRIVELDESGTVPDGAVACFGGRSVRPDGTLGSPICGVTREGLSDDRMLKPGDVLVRSIAGLKSSGAPVIATRVTEEALPATFDTTCIRVRWKAEVTPLVADLVTGYLSSAHARDWLIAHGVDLHVTIAALRGLEVPEPSSEVLGALDVLADAELQYRAWAEEAEMARRSLFATPSFADQVLTLLAAQRAEVERLRAARDAGGLDYRIRNYYPHPIALRRDFIQQMEPGEAQVRAVLDCAEHLITLLALMAMLQEWSEEASDTPLQGRLLAYAQHDALHLDWGKCFSVLQEGVHFTARHPNPLALNFPDLTELGKPMADESSAWYRAERRLRVWRNQQAHLQRLPDLELVAMSEEAVHLLDQLLETVAFLGTVPLVRVADYERSLTGERRATFNLLQGSSVAFQRTVRTVDSELPRGAIGFLARQERFVPAFPWLVMDACPVCKRPEVFVFNRHEKRLPTYIAMESGHPRANHELSPVIGALIQNRPRADEIGRDDKSENADGRPRR